MASRQFKEDRAEAAARIAAKDIGEVNREREREQGFKLGTEREFKEARAEVAAKLAAKDLEDANTLKQREEGYSQENQRPGVIGSMFKAVQDTVGHAKDAVVGKTHDAASATSEYAGYAAHKAGETKDATVNKASEYTGYAADKAKEAKDTTEEKAGEYKDYTAETAKEGKDATLGKLGELKDKAMGFFSGKKDETKHTTAHTLEEAKHNEKLAEEEAKRKLEELKLRGKGYRDEVSGGAYHESRNEGERGKAAKSNILGAMGSVGEAIKSKLTYPSDVVEESRAALEQGGTGRRGEKVVIEVEESRPGAVADTLKAADQMTGQAFNDVGRIDDEATIRMSHRK